MCPHLNYYSISKLDIYLLDLFVGLKVQSITPGHTKLPALSPKLHSSFSLFALLLLFVVVDGVSVDGSYKSLCSHRSAICNSVLTYIRYELLP